MSIQSRIDHLSDLDDGSIEGASLTSHLNVESASCALSGAAAASSTSAAAAQTASSSPPTGTMVMDSAAGNAAAATLTASAPGTLQQLANYLESGYWAYNGSNFNWKWNKSNLTFNVQSLTAEQQTWARQAFIEVSRVCNLTFTETTGTADISFTAPSDSSGAYAYFNGSSGTITASFVNIQQSWASWSATNLYYNYYFQTYLHEIGHALGLGHQGPYNGSATYPTDAAYDNDSWQLSVMSYFDQTDNTYAGLLGSFAYVTSYMQADILALQDKYGAPTSTVGHLYGHTPNVSGGGYNTGTGYGARSFTMYAADGWVALDTSDYSGTQYIRMDSGLFSSIYGSTDNVSQYNSTMTSYNGGSGVDDVTLATSAPLAAGGVFVYGNNGNDIFRSSGGVDHTLDGGSGSDTLIRTGFTLGVDGVLRRTSQSGNGWMVDGTTVADDYLTNVEQAQLAGGTVTLRQAKSNFNFGGANDVGATSDVLLQNGGTVVDWIMQGGSYATGGVLTTGAVGYTVVGTGDFTGDGTADVLLQNGGTVVDWVMANGAYQLGNVLTTGATGYTVKGTGDFNNDGTYDVVLQNGNTVVDWIMKNGVYQSGNVITTNAGGFTVVGTGDFNGDGTADILLQNGSTIVEWAMSGGNFLSGSVVTTNATGYTVVGTGDFNGDGTTDIALQNGNTIVDWLMKNGSFQSGNVLTSNSGGYSVVGTGDYNGDGTSDLLLQNGGTVVTWTLSNGTYSAGHVVTSGASGYSVVG